MDRKHDDPFGPQKPPEPPADSGRTGPPPEVKEAEPLPPGPGPHEHREDHERPKDEPPE